MNYTRVMLSTLCLISSWTLFGMEKYNDYSDILPYYDTHDEHSGKVPSCEEIEEIKEQHKKVFHEIKNPVNHFKKEIKNNIDGLVALLAQAKRLTTRDSFYHERGGLAVSIKDTYRSLKWRNMHKPLINPTPTNRSQAKKALSALSFEQAIEYDASEENDSATHKKEVALIFDAILKSEALLNLKSLGTKIAQECEQEILDTYTITDDGLTQSYRTVTTCADIKYSFNDKYSPIKEAVEDTIAIEISTQISH
jgi:hypothetical protein